MSMRLCVWRVSGLVLLCSVGVVYGCKSTNASSAASARYEAAEVAASVENSDRFEEISEDGLQALDPQSDLSLLGCLCVREDGTSGWSPYRFYMHRNEGYKVRLLAQAGALNTCLETREGDQTCAAD